MRIVIANFSPPVPTQLDYDPLWRQAELPVRKDRVTLFEQRVDWGFHLYSIGVHLLDQGAADRVEFWDFSPERTARYLGNGVLKVTFHNPREVAAYVSRFGPPDLFINHGRQGVPVLRLLAGATFRVHVPALHLPDDGPLADAECFLVDAEEQLVPHSMLYVPVVNTVKIRPAPVAKRRDFVYLASNYPGKRHDLLIDAVRGTELTGHLHPVETGQLDLSGTRITLSGLDQRDVVELLQTSRIAVYPGDRTSNPAAMWECVAAGLPIVVNAAILGGRHLVVPGVTGEFAEETEFVEVMRSVLHNRDRYTPREHFETTWDTVTTIEGYLAFFRKMGWNA